MKATLLKIVQALTILSLVVGTAFATRAYVIRDLTNSLANINRLPAEELLASQHVCRQEGGLVSVIGNKIVCANDEAASVAMDMTDALVIYRFNSKYEDNAVKLADVIPTMPVPDPKKG